MEGTTEPDVWVVARISALERANRRLWIGLAALGMALVTLLAVAGLIASMVRVPAGLAGGGSAAEIDAGLIRASEVSVTSALRLVDEQGRDLVRIARDAPVGGSGASQTAIGVFASLPDGPAPQPALRLAASPLGSALSLGMANGVTSASLFVAADGASLELRNGERARVVSDSDGGAVVSRPAAVAAPAPTASAGAHAEGTVVSRPNDAANGLPVDLTDGVFQPLGQDFYVGRLSLSDEGGGLRVSGRIVNAGSVDQLRVEFRLTVASRDLPFSVARIGAGNSTPFSLEIPKATSAELRGARLRWVRSTVSYGTE